jgi:hypothetical protein
VAAGALATGDPGDADLGGVAPARDCAWAEAIGVEGAPRREEPPTNALGGPDSSADFDISDIVNASAGSSFKLGFLDGTSASETGRSCRARLTGFSLLRISTEERDMPMAAVRTEFSAGFGSCIRPTSIEPPPRARRPRRPRG